MPLESTQSALSTFGSMEFFINVLGVFSTILLGIFTLLSVILGFLVWKHEEMRKRAQEEVKKVEELSSKISTMYEHLGLLVETARGELTLMASRNDSLSKLLEGAEGDSKLISATRDEVAKIKAEIKVSVNSLATISRFIPSPSPSASPSQEYSPEVVKRAMEIQLQKLQGK